MNNDMYFRSALVIPDMTFFSTPKFMKVRLFVHLKNTYSTCILAQILGCLQIYLWNFLEVNAESSNVRVSLAKPVKIGDFTSKYRSFLGGYYAPKKTTFTPKSSKRGVPEVPNGRIHELGVIECRYWSCVVLESHRFQECLERTF